MSLDIKKLDAKANKGVLIGYSQNQYRIQDLELNRPLQSRDVKILENKFINTDNTNTSININNNNNGIEISLNKPNNLNLSPNNDISDLNSNLSSNDLSDDLSDLNPKLSLNDNTSESSTNITNNNNNDNSDISESNTLDNELLDKLALVLLNNINNEPKTYKQAIESLNKQDWLNAMNNEIKELESQNTWIITKLPLNKKPLRGKWVYKIKSNNKGNIIKYKARWVIKGFNQILGIDYLDTFSTIYRPKIYS